MEKNSITNLPNSSSILMQNPLKLNLDKKILEKPKFSEFYLSGHKTASSLKLRKLRKSSTFYNPLNPEEVYIKQDFLLSLNSELRQFCENRSESIDICENVDKLIFCGKSVEERLNCYRAELGETVCKIFNSYQKLIEKSLIFCFKQVKAERSKGQQLIKEYIDKLEKSKQEKDQISLKNDNLKQLFSIQESEFKITKVNCDSLQNEVILLHELLKRDVSALLSHLSDLENVSNKGLKNNPGDHLADDLENLNGMLINLEEEQAVKKDLISGMNNLLKAMIKDAKRDAFTQVESAELLWKAEEIVNNNHPKEENIESSLQSLEKIEFRSENWGLPPILMTFLSNTLKNKESGRVLPWLFFKKIIFEIYKNRLNYRNEINNIFGAPLISFEEFLILDFLRIHKTRRLAELKLLEFLISLRYYITKWPRAQLFGYMIKVIPYEKVSSESGFIPKIDIYSENFFLFVIKNLFNSLEINEENDGNCTVPLEKTLKIVENILDVFVSEVDKRKIISKISKTKKQESIIDFDKLIDIILQEYFEARKNRYRMLSKSFANISEKENYILNFDDYKEIFNKTENSSNRKGFVLENEWSHLRNFNDSLINGTNGFNILGKDFVQTIKKFGLDSPFPTFKDEKDTENITKNVNKKMELKENTLQLPEKKENINKIESPTLKNIIDNIPEISTTFFAQHFSILKELKNYCSQFKNAVIIEKNEEILMNHFDNISNILDTACNFLNFPIIYKK